MAVKILVVDDAAFMRIRCKRMLNEHGYDVIEASNGREAIQKYLQHQPQAVLMDITMPEMDGIEALRGIRKIDPNARVAMVTAIGQEAVVIDALKAGARDFVVKPFQQDRVLAAIDKITA